MVILQFINITILPNYPKSDLTPVSSFQFWFGYLFPPSRLFEFLIGSISARLVLNNKWPRFRLWHAVLLAIAGYIVINLVPFVWTFNVSTIVPITILISTIAAFDAKGYPSFLHSPVMQWLGNISFGFYLVQGVTVFWIRQAMNNITFSTPIAILIILGIFIITLISGWALYSLVEEPIMRRFSRSRYRHSSN